MSATGVLDGVLKGVTGKKSVKYSTFLGKRKNGHILRDTLRSTLGVHVSGVLLEPFSLWSE